MKQYTLEQLAAMPKEFYTPAEVAGVLGTTDQAVRVTARQKPWLLGFPVVMIGNRVKIPRKPFLRTMGWI